MAEDIVSRLVLQGQQYFGTINQAHQRTQKFQKDSQRGFQNVTSSINLATKALVAYGAVRILRVIGRQITETARLGDELSKMSQRTGLAVETLNGLTQAAGLADVSQEQLSVSLFQLNKNLLDTTRGTGEAKESFRAMGIGGKEAAALLKDPDEAFFSIVDRLAAIPDPSRRAAEAMRIFGRSGAQLLPLINQGSEAIRKQSKELHENRKITTEMAKASENYNDAMNKLTRAYEGFLLRGIGPTLPSLTRFLELMTELIALDTDSLGFRFKTLGQDLFTSLQLINDLLANPLDYEAILKKYEALDKQFMEERRKRFAKPDEPDLTPTLDTVPVTAKAPSAELASVITLRQAKLGLLEIEEKRLAAEEGRDAILTAAQRHLKAEIILLQQQLTIQKELEAAEKGKREVDPRVAETASVKARAELVALDVEEEAIRRKVNEALEEQRGIQQEILGTEKKHAAEVDFARKTRDLEAIALQSQHDLELARLDPMRDASLLRGQEILTLRDQKNLLEEQNEVLGATAERHREIELIQARINALIAEGAAIRQEAEARGSLQASQAAIQRQLEPFRQAVQQIQKEFDIGAAMPNTLPETQQLRQIELIEATTALLTEQWRLGLIASEDYYHQVGVLEAQHFALTEESQQGFWEGWQQAFQRFTGDAESAFGLGQTLARNFVSNLQSGLASTIGNIFDEATEGTLTWRTALETVPAILKRITSELIALLVVQTIAKALGAPTVPVSGMNTGGGAGAGAGLAGALGGLFGGGNQLGPPTATGAGFFNPSLIPQAAMGGSFMVNGMGGTDRNLAQVRVTKGERVDVLTPAQQQRTGNFIVNITNVAGDEVHTAERDGPDGKILDVLIERKIQKSMLSGVGRKSTASAFGLPIRGRVG